MFTQPSELRQGTELIPNNENNLNNPASANSQFHLIPNQIGKYKIIKRIGSGAYSQVFLVIDFDTGNQLCVKIVSKSTIQTEVDTIQFAREIKTLSSISHPNVIKFIEFLEDENNYYIVQELCNGASLFQFINAAEGPLSEGLTRVIFRQLIEALIFLHQNGIYHRDIKLENILVNKDMTIKIIDFGFCAYGNQDSLLRTICGSLHYLPPECIRGEAYSGALSDVWSSGVVLFVLLTKLMPFNGSSQPQIIKSIVECNYEIPSFLSPSCEDLIQRIFVRDPCKRITAEQILCHPWLSNEQKMVSNSSFKTKSSLLTMVDHSKLSKKAITRRRSFSSTKPVNENANNIITSPKLENRKFSQIPKIPQKPCQTFANTNDNDNF